jgi:methionyl aminopeptidase
MRTIRRAATSKSIHAVAAALPSGISCRHFFGAAAAASSSSSSTIGAISDSATQNAAAFDSHYGYTRTSANRIHRKSRTPVVAHAVSKQRTVPADLNITPPPYAKTGMVTPGVFPNQVLLHDEPSIERMRTAARLARKVLDKACTLAEEGVTTDNIDGAVHSAILRAGAYPSPLNYSGFPKSVCSSINEVICHGIPDARSLRNGDIVSFDVSCFVGGVHGDNCATVIVGDVDKDGISADDATAPKDWRGVPQKTKFANDEEQELFVTGRRLVQAALESLNEGVAVCKPGACLSDIGKAIHAVADAYNYDTVRKYRGHGISEEFHCAPFVKHYRNSDALILQPGMIFTIEPMLTEGNSDCYEWNDAWTVATVDGGRSAQFEHTVLITEDGVEILTLPEDSNNIHDKQT